MTMEKAMKEFPYCSINSHLYVRGCVWRLINCERFLALCLRFAANLMVSLRPGTHTCIWQQ